MNLESGTFRNVLIVKSSFNNFLFLNDLYTCRWSVVLTSQTSPLKIFTKFVSHNTNVRPVCNVICKYPPLENYVFIAKDSLTLTLRVLITETHTHTHIHTMCLAVNWNRKLNTHTSPDANAVSLRPAVLTSGYERSIVCLKVSRFGTGVTPWYGVGIRAGCSGGSSPRKG